MRVLFIDQIAKVNYKYSFSLAQGLVENGTDVEMAIDLKQENEELIIKKYNLFNTDEKNISKVNKLVNYISSYRKIEKIISNREINVLHTQWVIFSPLDYYFLKKIKKKFNVRLITTVHDILPFNEKFYDKFFHRKIYELSDSIIVQAQQNLERINNMFNNIDEKTVMIPHGHFLKYAKILDKNIARKKLNIPEDKFVVLFFGQIKKVKGVDLLLNAMADICKNNDEICLVVAGNMWKDDRETYEKLIDELGIRDKIKWDIRYIPDDEVDYYYSATDICVLPYRDVYQSGVIQLVYAHKKTPVASRLPAFTQFVVEDKTGFLFDVGDVSSLKNAILKAYMSKSMLNRIGENGYSVISDELDWNKIAKKIANLYRVSEK